jgi:hypothetical protein
MRPVTVGEVVVADVVSDTVLVSCARRNLNAGGFHWDMVMFLGGSENWGRVVGHVAKLAKPGAGHAQVVVSIPGAEVEVDVDDSSDAVPKSRKLNLVKIGGRPSDVDVVVACAAVAEVVVEVALGDDDDEDN